MAIAATTPLERARGLAVIAATLAIVGAILIALGAIARDVVGPAAEVLRSREISPDFRGALDFLSATAAFWVLALPSLLLAGALLDLGKVLDEYGKGQFFTLKASAGVRRAGEGALWALAFKIVLSPTLYDWIAREGRVFVWNMEPFDLGLVAFAAFVMVLGRVLEAAARLKADHDQIV